MSKGGIGNRTIMQIPTAGWDDHCKYLEARSLVENMSALYFEGSS